MFIFYRRKCFTGSGTESQQKKGIYQEGDESRPFQNQYVIDWQPYEPLL